MANTRHIEGERYVALDPSDPGYDALTDLWNRMDRPFDAAHAIEALVGMPVKEVRRRIGVHVVLSPQAERLLDEFPRTIRSLATSMKTQAERCMGELRGPVLWSETMSARASTFGANDVYVCATPSRAYDIVENQVLRFALEKLHEAASEAMEGTTADIDDLEYRQVRRNGNDASRFSDHPTMARVSLKRPNLRTLKRTRSGKKARAYMPAIDFLDHLIEPVDLDFVRPLRDDRTAREHTLFMQVIHLLEGRSGKPLPELRVTQRAIVAGPVQYRNRSRSGAPHAQSGVIIGQLLLDLPPDDPSASRAESERELAERAGDRPSMVVWDDDDVTAAVDRAVQLARQKRT